MEFLLKDCKNLKFLKNSVTIEGSLNENSKFQLDNLAKEISKI